MSPGRVFLLRHGETEWSTTGRHTGRTDVPLTDTGREQAVAVAAVLKAVRGGGAPEPALVLSSPRQRATETADLAGLHPDRIEPLLAEWDYGRYEGRTTPEIRREVPGWTVWTHPCPGGETPAQVSGRADAVLAQARTAATGGDVLLVGHGHFSRVLTARWLDLPVAAGVGFALAAGAVTVLGDERGVPRLDHVNIPPR